MSQSKVTAETPWSELPHALRIPEVGVVLRVSRKTVYDLVNSGVIRSVRTTPNRRVVSKCEVARFLGIPEGPSGEVTG